MTLDPTTVALIVSSFLAVALSARASHRRLVAYRGRGSDLTVDVAYVLSEHVRQSVSRLLYSLLIVLSAILWGTAWFDPRWPLVAMACLLTFNSVATDLGERRVRQAIGARLDVGESDPLISAEAAHIRQATALGREIAHAALNEMAVVIGVLDALNAEPNLTDSARASLHDAITSAVTVTERINDLHGRVRDMDPSYRGPS